MAKTLYFDCFSGASGDMVLGALLDLGLPLDELRAALGSLAIDCGELSAERVLRAGVAATKFNVRQRHADQGAAEVPHAHASARDAAHSHEDPHPHPHDHQHIHSHSHHSLKEITAAINRSALPTESKQRAIHLFERLAEAEAAIHQMPIEKVHLHEVGALDSIVDIVGAVYGLDQLRAHRIVSSPLNVGGGTVTCAHGVFPVPAPATARLLEGVPIRGGELQMELVTPTGALLVTGYADSYGPMPAMTLSKIGYGAGDRDPKRHPNVLRLVLGDAASGEHLRSVVELVCEIDDMNPQLFGPLMDRLLGAGALDVYYVPVQMKKNRPGTLVTVLARPERREALTGLLFAETTTIGVRYREMQRECLEREWVTVETPFGSVRFKLAQRDGRIVNAAPEFDDCERLASERGVPVKDIQAAALKAWLSR